MADDIRKRLEELHEAVLDAVTTRLQHEPTATDISLALQLLKQNAISAPVNPDNKLRRGLQANLDFSRLSNKIRPLRPEDFAAGN